jgi:hypothetical protein
MATLSKVVQSYLNTVEQHIDASHNLADSMQVLAPMFNKATQAEQVEIRNSVAYLIGTKKKVVPKVMEKGANRGCMGFNAHGSQAEKQARDMLRYYLPSAPKKVVGKTPTKKPDAVTKLLTQFKALTSAQRKAFLAKI